MESQGLTSSHVVQAFSSFFIGFQITGSHLGVTHIADPPVQEMLFFLEEAPGIILALIVSLQKPLEL
jgi:hydrogenase/urease accessory protein HupE